MDFCAVENERCGEAPSRRKPLLPLQREDAPGITLVARSYGDRAKKSRYF